MIRGGFILDEMIILLLLPFFIYFSCLSIALQKDRASQVCSCISKRNPYLVGAHGCFLTIYFKKYIWYCFTWNAVLSCQFTSTFNWMLIFIDVTKYEDKFIQFGSLPHIQFFSVGFDSYCNQRSYQQQYPHSHPILVSEMTVSKSYLFSLLTIT